MASNGSADFRRHSITIETHQLGSVGSEERMKIDAEDVQLATKNSSFFNVQELISHILHFLSTASGETLGACVVGLGAITYMVFGRVGLILIGVVGGIILHATWEDHVQSQANDEIKASEARIRQERGLAIIERILDWRDRNKDSKDNNSDNTCVRDAETAIISQLEFLDSQSAVKATLAQLIDAVIRDHVRWWYHSILPAESLFPLACRQMLVNFFHTLSLHLSRKRPADTFLDFLTHSSSIVIVFLNELSAALMHTNSANTKASDAIYRYLEVSPDSNLAHVLDIEQQRRKFQAVADDVLQNFLDPKLYDCKPVRVFFREVLAGVILEKSVQSCSKPEWINRWIVYLLEESETGIFGAIDDSVNQATANGFDKRSSKSKSSDGLAENFETSGVSESQVDHKRTVSRAEVAMEEALLEAKRLSELIAEEEARKEHENSDTKSSEYSVAEELTALPTESETNDNANGTQLESDHEKSGEGVEGGQAYGDANHIPSTFTNFDQIISSQKLNVAQSNNSELRSISVPALTLHNAKISIFDDAQPGEKANMRSKPTIDYLLQIEPTSSQYPGWMIARKYADFETLHEVLRRISVVSGVPVFAQKHSSLPTWKNRTKISLRSDLENYLRDALSFNRLAESEGMKRFLEKDQGTDRGSTGKQKGAFGFPGPAAFETMGKGMLDVLANAPKGAAGGGKAILGGVTGVLGGVGSLGQRKQASYSNHNVSKAESNNFRISANVTRDSDDLGRHSFTAPIEARGSTGFSSRSSLSLPESSEEKIPTLGEFILDTGSSPHPLAEIPKNDVFQSSNHDRKSNEGTPETMRSDLHLPPPPSEISDDYKMSQDSYSSSVPADESTTNSSLTSIPQIPPQPPPRLRSSSLQTPNTTPASPSQPARKKPPLPITEKETQVAIELFFAVINELYTLSSAWNIRRTLLNAAKSFLLRPGNPNLEAIRLLLQDTIIDANTSDAGIAAHITKLRQNVLPTEDELKTWPTNTPSDEDKEKLRAKARKLLVERGMPQALTSVMGAAASGEALGRVFDSLQVEEVARGIVFALLLQAVRAITQ